MAVNVRKIEDGSVHLRANMWISSFLFVAISAFCILVLKLNPVHVLSKLGLITTGVIIGSWLSTPDTDLVHSLPIRNWGLLSFIWSPYRLFIAKKHRSVISHGIETPCRLRKHKIRSFLFKMFGFTLGSIVRTLYLLFIALVIALMGNWVFSTNLFLEAVLRFVFSEVALYLFIGIWVADGLHTKVDLLGNRRAL